jgi:C4-dicarboxylate-specific signal transduction histidine kinase
MQESAAPQTPALSEEGPDVWGDARRAVANLESSTGATPRWLAAVSTLIVALLLLLASFAANHINAERARETLSQVQHHTAVIEQTADTNLALLRVGVALRSYALAGASFQAETYLGNWKVLDRRFAELAKLVSANPLQTERTARLKTEIDRYFVGYDAARGRAMPDKQEVAKRLSASTVAEHDRQTGVRVRALFDAIANTERDTLAAMRLEAESDQRRLQWIAIICFVLAILAGVVSLLLMQGEKGRSRLRELQLEFMHTQRLALMGQTSVAIAHEVNQPLTAASNYLAVLRNISAGGGQLPPERIKEIVPKIDLQIRRAGEIVQRLRNFLAVRGGERVNETPKTLIADAVDLLGTLDNTIKLETHIELGLPPVLVDRVQVQQVLVNLMRNALEAMKDKPQRRLILRASVMAGRKVKISIEDNGSGLPDQVARNLFKPFVSSKRSGMGVGLSICHTIITAHGGQIWADSTPKGATFHFTLPAAHEA